MEMLSTVSFSMTDQELVRAMIVLEKNMIFKFITKVQCFVGNRLQRLPNSTINAGSKKRRAFVAPLFTASYSER